MGFAAVQRRAVVADLNGGAIPSMVGALRLGHDRTGGGRAQLHGRLDGLALQMVGLLQL